MPEPCRQEVADVRARVWGRLAAEWRADLGGPSRVSRAMSPISATTALAHARLQERRPEPGDVHDGDPVVLVDGGDERPRPVAQGDVGEADRGVQPSAFRAWLPRRGSPRRPHGLRARAPRRALRASGRRGGGRAAPAAARRGRRRSAPAAQAPQPARTHIVCARSLLLAVDRARTDMNLYLPRFSRGKAGAL